MQPWFACGTTEKALQTWQHRIAQVADSILDYAHCTVRKRRESKTAVRGYRCDITRSTLPLVELAVCRYRQENTVLLSLRYFTTDWTTPDNAPSRTML